MPIRRIVVATDESIAGRRAVEVALQIARPAGARVTAVRVMPIGADPITPVIDPALSHGVPTDVAVVFGAPSIEICRFAETNGGDLLVLGRKSRPQLSRLLSGDTADATVRRSRIPCLLVPANARTFGRVLAAVDGTPRGMLVLNTGCAFARTVDGRLRIVTVEGDLGDPVRLATTFPSTRSERVISAAREKLDTAGVAVGDWRGDSTSFEFDVVDVRHGSPFEQILDAQREDNADVLAIGYHRGGPPSILEAGSTARRLIHAAPCAVLTVPL